MRLSFRITVEELKKKGCEVTVYPEKEFVEKRIAGEFIFDMARDRATIDRLKELEDEGSLVVNSAYGIDRCVRKAMTELLMANGIPHPKALSFRPTVALNRTFSHAGSSGVIRMPW